MTPPVPAGVTQRGNCYLLRGSHACRILTKCNDFFSL